MNFNPNDLECWITGKPKDTKDGNAQPVKQYDLSGNLLNTYPSINAAGKATGIYQSTIGKAALSGKVSLGFKWEYA